MEEFIYIPNDGWWIFDHKSKLLTNHNGLTRLISTCISMVIVRADSWDDLIERIGLDLFNAKITDIEMRN